MTATRAPRRDSGRTAGHARPVDPRSPFVLDTRELGRRPGAMRQLRREVPTPSGWVLDLVRVPTGAVAVLDLRIESVMDGVLVTGTVDVPIEAECGRCLEPLRQRLTVDVQELFVYERSGDPDDDQPLVAGDHLDLEPLLHDAVLLALPVNPVCRDDCAGLCARCGVRLAEAGDDHHHQDLDPRWAALSGVPVDDPETEN